MADKTGVDDVIGYKGESYYSPEELTLLRNTFSDPKMVALLRKVFLPTFNDATLPIEQVGKDYLMIGRNWDAIPAEEAKILVVARQEAAKFIIGGLIELKQIASSKDETELEKAYRRSKDSTK